MFDDRKSKAGAAGLPGMDFIHTVESFKHFFLMFRRNADTSILYTQQHFTGFLSNSHFHSAAGLVVLNGIVAKVVDDLIQQSADTIHNAIFADDLQRNTFQFCSICKCFTDFLRKNFEGYFFMGHM